MEKPSEQTQAQIQSDPNQSSRLDWCFFDLNANGFAKTKDDGFDEFDGVSRTAKSVFLKPRRLLSCLTLTKKSDITDKKSPKADLLLDKKTQKYRLWELDFLRGICVLLMIVDHFFFHAGHSMFTIEGIFSLPHGSLFPQLQTLAALYLRWSFRQMFRHIVVFSFCFICGVSCTLSKSNLKRGIKAAFAAGIITLATFLVEFFTPAEGFVIWFGVIHMYAASILIYCGLSAIFSFFKKIPTKTKNAKTALKWISQLMPAFVGMVFLVFYFLYLGQFSRSGTSVTILSQVEINADRPDSFINFMSVLIYITNPSVVVGSDYFPIFPYAAVILTGTLAGQLIYNTKAREYLRPLNGAWNKPIVFLGKNALLVYLLHVVAIVSFFVFSAWIVSG